MHDELTLDEMSTRTGEPLVRLHEWRQLGLIGRDGTDRFVPTDVDRVRIAQLLLRRGISIDALAAGARAGTVDRWLQSYFEQRNADGGPLYTVAEAAGRACLDAAVAQRLWEAVAVADAGELLSDSDVEMLHGCAVALDAGLPEEALVQLLRVYADALAKVAEASERLIHFYVYERRRAESATGSDLPTFDQLGVNRLIPLVQPALAYFHRKGQLRAVLDDALTHLAEELGSTPPREQVGELLAAVAFIDLASFTPLAEVMGDVKAAEVLEQFGRIVREATTRWSGRVVKQIGDAFMLVFPDPRSAVGSVLDIERTVAGQPSFPAARSGVHWGSVLYREGDYVGASVNLASRVAAAAARHQVLVTAAVRLEVGGLDGVRFVPLGRQRLKGISDAIELFEARPADVPQRDRLLDPVCGMELVPDEVAYRLTFGGGERAFCSETCLQRFVASPDAYA